MTSEYVEETRKVEERSALREASEDALMNLPIFITGIVMVIALLHDWFM